MVRGRGADRIGRPRRPGPLRWTGRPLAAARRQAGPDRAPRAPSLRARVDRRPPARRRTSEICRFAAGSISGRHGPAGPDGAKIQMALVRARAADRLSRTRSGRRGGIRTADSPGHDSEGGNGACRWASLGAAAAHAEHQVSVDGLRLLDPFHEAVLIRFVALRRLAGADDQRGDTVKSRHESRRIGEVGCPGRFRRCPRPLSQQRQERGSGRIVRLGREAREARDDPDLGLGSEEAAEFGDERRVSLIREGPDIHGELGAVRDGVDILSTADGGDAGRGAAQQWMTGAEIVAFEPPDCTFLISLNTKCYNLRMSKETSCEFIKKSIVYNQRIIFVST